MIDQQNAYLSTSPYQTLDFGRNYAKKLKPGDVVCLHGDLGAGKTHLIKGIASHFGVQEMEIQSPTFTIINEYHGGSIPIYHFDFYRIKSPQEAIRMGIEEYLFGDGICLIEWPSKIAGYLPEEAAHIHLKHENEHSRKIFVYTE